MPAKKTAENDGAKTKIKSAEKSAQNKKQASETPKQKRSSSVKASASSKVSSVKKSAQSTKKSSPQKAAAAKKSRSGQSRTAGFSAYNGKTLVVVESPAKARTLEKILGAKYKVLASAGHVLDLPKGRLAIDVEHGFEPEYIQVRGKADLIKTLKGASAASAQTILASDPDREGEAIAWHLAGLLGIEKDSRCRIRMHEITERGVKNAIAEPDRINEKLVEAQQARRVLDRLVGYELSPLLWYKVQRGLSAGRVQSVALRIICEREDEIERFIPEEYWLVDVSAAASGNRNYKLRVEKYNNKPLTISNEKEAQKAEDEIRAGRLIVDEFSTKENAKEPNPPFRTSTLQQEASRRLGFAPKRTMRIAQSLYEGVDIPGRGPTGLITYMRTDSLRLAPEAIDASRSFIASSFGEKYLPAKPKVYSPKGRAQDAHEAIRATDANLTPESVKEHLTQEQYRLYELIWSRFIASQMSDARIARTNLICSSAGYQMKQSGVAVTFDGWGRVYPLGIKDVTMEPARAGEELSVTDITKEQKFTQPQPRYTEAGLVKILEEKGIGRPSTYAVIIDTLSLRGYVEHCEDDKRLMPTKLGRVVNSFLVRYFSSIINESFTAEMEKELDQVESGDADWEKLVSGFWGSFKPEVDNVSENAENMRPEAEKTGEKCPECGKDLVIKRGRFGEFIACSGYPECRYTRNIIKTTGIKCPKCGQGELVRRKATKGKTAGRFFYGCTRYPECDYVSWKKPAKAGAASEEAQDTYDKDM